jgi:uncharacterized membrane protein required for colicin V production
MVMHYTTMDYVAIFVLAAGTAVQFLRGARDFSRVLYEAGFIIAAVAGTNSLYRPVSQLVRIQGLVVYVVLFLVFFVLALILANLLNHVIPFGLGMFNYVFALIVGFVTAYSVGHVVLRVALNIVGKSNPEFAQAVMQSWVSRELLYFKTWIEILAQLRQVRWLNV